MVTYIYLTRLASENVSENPTNDLKVEYLTVVEETRKLESELHDIERKIALLKKKRADIFYELDKRGECPPLNAYMPGAKPEIPGWRYVPVLGWVQDQQ